MKPTLYGHLSVTMSLHAAACLSVTAQSKILSQTMGPQEAAH